MPTALQKHNIPHTLPLVLLRQPSSPQPKPKPPVEPESTETVKWILDIQNKVNGLTTHVEALSAENAELKRELSALRESVNTISIRPRPRKDYGSFTRTGDLKKTRAKGQPPISPIIQGNVTIIPPGAAGTYEDAQIERIRAEKRESMTKTAEERIAKMNADIGENLYKRHFAGKATAHG